jgi:hypothetical protein
MLNKHICSGNKVQRKSLQVGEILGRCVKLTLTYFGLSEYAAGGQVMASGDVYAFGTILLEMFTGRRPTDDMFKDGVSIVSFVEAKVSLTI